jgi:predicted unusual protein kinase regulating ubiquinone biosynthesis (AarF/ABC1/UbiB family)
VTNDGVLCLLDFGLCAEVDQKSREAMTKAIVHLLYRDFDSLIHSDAKELGFLPYDFDTEELKPILTKVLTGGLLESGSNLTKRKRKLQEISNELNEIFFRYPFQVPSFFALVTRGLGLLEGIALVGDPDFDIFMASAPYATKRAATILGEHSFRRMSRNFTRRRISET